MTNEEMQRTMEFILNQQAQFVVDIQKLQESQQRLQESQGETNQLLNRLAAATVKGFEDVNAKINALVDAQMRTDEALVKGFEETNAKISALIDAQMRTDEDLRKTDEALRKLTASADQYFRDRQNGG